jgi:hypothetical protein
MRNSVLATNLEQRVADFRHTYDRVQRSFEDHSATSNARKLRALVSKVEP